MNKSMQNGFHGDENKGPRIFQKIRSDKAKQWWRCSGRTHVGRGWIASPPPFHYPTWCFISGSLSLSPSCDVLACVTKVLILALFCSSAYQRACRGYVSRGYRVTSSFVEKRQWSERQGLVRHKKKKESSVARFDRRHEWIIPVLALVFKFVVPRTRLLFPIYRFTCRGDTQVLYPAILFFSFWVSLGLIIAPSGFRVLHQSIHFCTSPPCSAEKTATGSVFAIRYSPMFFFTAEVETSNFHLLWGRKSVWGVSASWCRGHRNGRLVSFNIFSPNRHQHHHGFFFVVHCLSSPLTGWNSPRLWLLYSK